eukprot:357958-Chlamydomonas_euryale.AAC.6
MRAPASRATPGCRWHNRASRACPVESNPGAAPARPHPSSRSIVLHPSALAHPRVVHPGARPHTCDSRAGGRCAPRRLRP